MFRTYWRLREVLGNKYDEAQIRALAATPFAVLCRPEVTKNLICASPTRPGAVQAFLEICAGHGLAPVAVQVSQTVGELLLASGGHLKRMGDEALIDLPSFDLDLPGKRFAKLRPLRNKAKVCSVTVREITYAEVPFEQVDAVSRQWLSRKINQRELGMLLRPLPSRDEPDVRKFAALLQGALVGIVAFNPLYADCAVVGHVADIERYVPYPSGIHDLLLLEGIRVFQAEGRRLLSLGLSPLSHLDEPGNPRPRRGACLCDPVGRGRRYPTPAAPLARARKSPRAAKQNGKVNSMGVPRC